MSNTVRDRLVAEQAKMIADLEAERDQFLADGNEYYAHEIEADIVVAKSPARLIHKAS